MSAVSAAPLISVAVSGAASVIPVVAMLVVAVVAAGAAATPPIDADVVPGKKALP